MCKVESYFKVSVYFVASVFSLALNIVSTVALIWNRQDWFFDAFDLQEITRVGQSFYIMANFNI